MSELSKYRVVVTLTETYQIDVDASSEGDALDLVQEEYDLSLYLETEDIEYEVTKIGD